jgi:uncharacterized protein YndB with AHSA1/START domain
MAEATRRRSGFLVLADITGYTAFLTASELEHAQGVIEDLTNAILGSLTPPLSLVKLEGDCVFAHSREDASTDFVLDLVERAYCDFADCRDDMQRRTTCTCTACANIPTLDLKFVVHRGEYVAHSAGGQNDLAGPDVILAHRLLKNRVREETGCAAYALFTDAACAAAPGLALTRHAEEVEDFGEVQGGVLDLGESLKRFRTTRRVFLEEGECDFSYTMHLPVSPAEAWDWWTDPSLLPQWQAEVESQRLERNQSGRRGVEGLLHCSHGSYETRARYLDWQPFSYYTAERLPSRRVFTAPPRMVETVEFSRREDGGTDVTYRFRMKDRGFGSRLKMRLLGPMARRMFSKDAGRLRTLIARRDGDARPTAEG